MTLEKTVVSFDLLVASIRQAHEELAAQASRAVNASLTLRNWLIGHYIAEYEQRGADRAQYGEKLLERLALRLRQEGLEGVAARSLRLYRQFYQTYPQIRQSVTAESVIGQHDGIWQSPPAISGAGSASSEIPIRESPTPPSLIDGQILLTRLSFTHLAELIAIEDDIKRTFYETECLRGNWSVRELKRQIARAIGASACTRASC